jgi:hypothetical protein
VVLQGRAGDVRHVLVGGKVRVRDGRVAGLDEAALAHEAQAAATALLARL